MIEDVGDIYHIKYEASNNPSNIPHPKKGIKRAVSVQIAYTFKDHWSTQIKSHKHYINT